MSIIRQDLASKDWTIFSTERAKRPFDYKKEEKKTGKKRIPEELSILQRE